MRDPNEAPDFGLAGKTIWGHEPVVTFLCPSLCLCNFDKGRKKEEGEGHLDHKGNLEVRANEICRKDCALL